MRAIIAALFCLVFAGGVGAVEIVVPGGHVSTRQSGMTVVGRADADEVAIELNGRQVGVTEVDRGWFHARVALPYGLNEIRLVAAGKAAGADSSQAELEVLCGPSIPRNYDRVFSPYSFHDGDDREVCLSCHARESVAGGADDAAWCFSCHRGSLQDFRPHVATDIRTCTSCHRMGEGLANLSTGVYTDMNPCYLCHKDKIGEFAQDYIHGPVAGGTCTVCHAPHGSRFAKNLRSPVPVLCLFCHTTVDDDESVYKHSPFINGDCVSCHDPHATANKWVLVKSSRTLCLNCHGKDGRLVDHQHPYDVKPRHELRGNLILAENGELECLTCHKAHGSDARNLLRSENENVCLGCHPEHG